MPLITITHSVGSDGLAVGRAVARGLAMELYDERRLENKALELGIPPGDLDGLDEKAPGLLDRLLDARPKRYLDILETLIYQVASSGEGVIVGHGSQILLQDFNCALHIRIHADLETRIDTLIRRQGLNPATAQKLVRKVDDQRRGFLRYAFHLDWNDPSLYDLTVNTSKIGIDTAAALIMHTVRSEDIRACSLNALDTMERLALSRRIQAAFVENDIETFTLNVDVPEKGVVVVSGLAKSLEDSERIPEIVRRLSEVKKVQTDIGIRAASI